MHHVFQYMFLTQYCSARFRLALTPVSSEFAHARWSSYRDRSRYVCSRFAAKWFTTESSTANPKPGNPLTPPRISASQPSSGWPPTNRNNIAAAEFKLGLIFLKYISDAFEERHQQLLAEMDEGADPEDPDVNRSKDIPGCVYEDFLTQFASAEEKNGGQFATPRCVVRVLVGMPAPHKARVYDPCCGSAGMFVQSENIVEVHGGRIPPSTLEWKCRWTPRIRRGSPSSSCSSQRSRSTTGSPRTGVKVKLILDQVLRGAL